MPEYDSLQKFIFEEIDIRGEIVRLDDSFITIMDQHNYPPVIRQLLGKALIAAVLLTGTLKFKGQLTLQFYGDKRIKILVAKCDDRLRIRGLAQFAADTSERDLEQVFLDGKLVVTIAPDNVVKPYQSIIPLMHQSIEACLEQYFAQSEQLATKIWLTVSQQQAAGMLLQLMPEQTSQERELFWEHAVKLGETLTDHELLTLDNPTLLYRLYHQETVRLFEPRSLMFYCPCSREKMENAVRILGKKEAETVLQSKPSICVTCEYCNQEFCFDKVDVAGLFH